MADTLAQADSGETMQPRPPRVISGALSLRPATLPELSAALQGMGLLDAVTNATSNIDKSLVTSLNTVNISKVFNSDENGRLLGLVSPNEANPKMGLVTSVTFSQLFIGSTVSGLIRRVIRGY